MKSTAPVEVQSRNLRKKYRTLRRLTKQRHPWELEERSSSITDARKPPSACSPSGLPTSVYVIQKNHLPPIAPRATDEMRRDERLSVKPGRQPNDSSAIVHTPTFAPCPTSGQPVRSLGPPYLQVYRLSLPSQTLPLLDSLRRKCEEHASCQPCGWKTNLYSLTKQDLAVNDVPAAREAALPITKLVLSAVHRLLGRPIRLDRNQPHVLKYDSSHKSVPLHHDLCDITVNIMLSRSHEYQGGGTYLPALGGVGPVRLQWGEMLIHPGNLLHSGCEIQSGERYLLVYFCKF